MGSNFHSISFWGDLSEHSNLHIAPIFLGDLYRLHTPNFRLHSENGDKTSFKHEKTLWNMGFAGILSWQLVRFLRLVEWRLEALCKFMPYSCHVWEWNTKHETTK